MRDITPEERAAAAARRLALAPGRAAGVTEAVIQAQVHAFYGKVRTDPMLGPIFEAKIADWDAHLAKLCDFWSSVTLATGRFKGAPMPAHMRLTGVGAQHFAHWLDIWRATAAETCEPAAAALLIDRAEMIARSLQMGMAVARGELPPVRSAPVAPAPVAHAPVAQADEQRGRQDENACQDKGRPGSHA